MYLLLKDHVHNPRDFEILKNHTYGKPHIFTFFIFLGSSTPHQNTLNNPILFWTPEKVNIREIPFFQKILTFKICTPLEKSRFLNIFHSIGIQYILFIYRNYYSTFSQDWVGKYILTYQGKEVGRLHLTYQGKQYTAIYSKTSTQRLLFTNRILTLHLTLYMGINGNKGKQRTKITI